MRLLFLLVAHHRYIIYIDLFNLCTDEDECAGAADICGSGECVNMGGSFKCVCLPGFDVLVNMFMFTTQTV